MHKRLSLEHELRLSRLSPAQVFAKLEAAREGRDIPIEPTTSDKKALALILAENTSFSQEPKHIARVILRERGIKMQRERSEDYLRSAPLPSAIAEQKSLLPPQQISAFFGQLKVRLSSTKE